MAGMTPGPRILVVDDLNINRHVVVRHLSERGFDHILEAANGREALETLATHDIDLVLLDVMMPEVDGYEVLSKMKSDGNMRHIPVIMITAVDDMESTVRCIENGAEDYLLKPFNPTLLNARINACLEKKRLQDVEREYLRHYDAVTGLPNQELFLTRLGEELARSRHYPRLFCVMIVRLERYRVVVDSLGQHDANVYVATLAKKLADEIPGTGVVARIGQHELAVLLRDLKNPGAGTTAARDIIEACADPLMINDHEIAGKISVGIAFSSTGYRNPQDMLRDAGLAANRAADSQENPQVFDDAMHHEAMRRLILEPELRRALVDQQLVLYYQPIVSLNSQSVRGFEALVRWLHPEKGLVPPDEFLRLAEETGQIVPIGHWVIEKACSQAAAWEKRMDTVDGFFIGVNVAASQFTTSGFVETLEDALEKTNIAGGRLKIELTETEIIDNPGLVEHILGAVKQMGIRAALDDFGTGYCSLSYLYRFPFDTIKIDQSFVRGIDDNRRNRDIVDSTIQLAHKLSMNVVAEGVETEHEAGVLNQLGCEYGQGNYFYPPVPEEEAVTLLTR